MAPNQTKENTKLMGLDLGVQLDERVLRWWIIIVLELTFAGIVSMFIILPQVQAIRKVNTELQKQQKIVADLTYKTELLSNFSLELNEYESIITSIYPGKKDTGLVLLNLRKMIEEHQVELRNYSVRDTVTDSKTRGGKSSQKSSQSVIFVETVVEGSAGNIKRMLETINSSLPLKHVEDFQVLKSLAKGSGDTGDRTEIVQAKIVYSAPFMAFDLTVDSQKPITPFSPAQQTMIETLKGYKNYLETLSTTTPTQTTPERNPDWVYQE